MATLKLNAVIPDGQSLADIFAAPHTFSYVAETEAAMKSGETFMTFKGEGFDPNEYDFGGGTLHSMTFNSGMDLYASLSKLKFDLGEVGKFGATGKELLESIMAGKDKVIGSKEADVLNGYAGNDLLQGMEGADKFDGGAGKDVLVGGKGSDHFLISLSSGNDVIKDFDARGGGALQDYLDLAPDVMEYRVVKRGDNLLIKITDGPTITLQDVSPSRFSDDDINWIF